MPKIRRHIHTDFTVVSNAFLRDKELSLVERGLLITMLSLPDGWNMTGRGLASILPDGRDKVYAALNKLEVNGYLKRVQIRENGTFKDTEYHFCDVPVFKDENQAVLEKEAKKAERKRAKKEAKEREKAVDPQKRASFVDVPKENDIKVEDVNFDEAQKTEEEKEKIAENFNLLKGKKLRKFIAKEVFKEEKTKENKAMNDELFEKIVAIFAEIIEKNPDRRKEFVGAGPLDALLLSDETKNSSNPNIVIRKYFLEEGVFLK